MEIEFFYKETMQHQFLENGLDIINIKKYDRIKDFLFYLFFSNIINEKEFENGKRRLLMKIEKECKIDE